MNIKKFKITDTLEKEKLLTELTKATNDLHEKNKHFSDEEIDRDIEYAKKHAPN